MKTLKQIETELDNKILVLEKRLRTFRKNEKTFLGKIKNIFSSLKN